MSKLALLAAVLIGAVFCAAGCGSALHSAALRGQTDIVRRELDKGAAIDGRYGLSKFTPLMAAASSGNPETVKLLLDRGADKMLQSTMPIKTAAEWAFVRFRTNPTEEQLRQVTALLGGGPAPAASAPGFRMRPSSLDDASPRPQPGNLDDAAYDRMRAAAGMPAEKRAQVSDVDSPSGKAAQRPDDFALVIGVEEYQSLPKADYGVRDARTMRKHLEALGFPARNIISLEGSQATKSKLESYLQEWLPLNVKASSTLFVYYSGHGAPDPKTGDAYLVPWDGDAKFLKSSAYPLKQLYADLQKTKAKRVLVALDACFSGAGGRSVLAQGARPLVAKSVDVPAGERMTVLAAASGDEITGTLEEQGHGLFTYHLLKGLSADPKASARSLHGYLTPKVQDDARRQNREQTPTLAGSSLDSPLLP